LRIGGPFAQRGVSFCAALALLLATAAVGRPAVAATPTSAPAAIPAPDPAWAAAPRSVSPAPTIAFVPLDDRPVTYQLPVMLGAIAGQPVLTPPRPLLGHYLTPGDPDGILRWLASPQTQGVSSIVASSDMLAYGGLVASRIPGVWAIDGFARLRALARVRAERPGAFVAVFGTIMRLAPTGVPALGPAKDYYATGNTVDLIQQYANLPDPPQSDAQRALAASLRERIGPALDAYLATRVRNREVDDYALQIAAEGGIDRLVLGQDDAGPSGLHLRDVAELQARAARFFLDDRASIEPGADELGMVLLAQAFARNVHWTPAVSVTYSRSDAAAFNDQLEFVPIDATIAHIINACGGRRTPSAAQADVELYVRVPGTSDADERAFEADLSADLAAGRSVAVADLTFLRGEPGPEQRALTETLIARGLAGKLDAYASWNTNANTVGTALATAIATGAGRRAGTFDARAHAQFMLDRYVDDYAFHQFVRPVLNADLRARGIDTTLLVPEIAREAAHDNRALLWPLALDLLAAIYPQYRDAGLTITLPWDRTFETEIDVLLKPADVR
jgi:hypothetical protein